LPGNARRSAAFSLLEVMIALAIFFMATFAILELVSRNLKMARAVQQTFVDPAILASELSLTNALTEGIESGDFGDLYPNASWERSIILASTNGLYQVDFLVSEVTSSGSVRTNGMSILLYRPQSTTGAGGGSTLRGGTGGRR
jgi:Tfp pilus assembly protein PilV